MSSNNPKSIIVQLDTKLNLVVGHFVKDDSQGFLKVEFDHEVDLSDRKVQLYQVFEDIWKTVLEKIKDSSVESIQLLIGPRAGFTNSRIIYIWARSHKMFNPETELKVLKTAKPYDLMRITNSQVQIWNNESGPDLEYSGEPRIGKK